ncbi:MAG TPA: sulfite exporter TauE/SafE family protein [Hyphomonadaceae bacterium]|nr:sulfite exporter TauE/SafE family protein [Hyphomonadaceae bacterium]
MDSYLLIVIAGAVLAGFVQGLSGFAFSLAALSIWAWAVDPQLAAPMAVFGSLVGQLVALPLTWKGTNLKRVAPFVIGGLMGVPLGIFLLGVLDPAGFKLGLGAFLLVYCPAMFFAPSTWALKWGGAWANGASGWVGGVFGGIGGFAGAIPQLWCTVRGWDKDTQRGVMQVFNICMHVATLTGYLIAGDRINGETLWMFVVITPALVVPVLLGALVFRRLDQRAFRRIVLGLLFVSGVGLTWSSVGAVFG